MKKGSRMTEESRAKMSLAHFGLKVSPETRTKMSAAQRNPSLEKRAKMSVAQVGKHHSPEVRAKISVANWKGGRAVWRPKRKAKRRALGFAPLNNPFDGADAHHVSKEYVVYMSKDLHRSVSHNVWTGKNMEQVNLLALSYLVRQLEAAA